MKNRRRKLMVSVFLVLSFLAFSVLPVLAEDGEDTITREILFSTDQEQIDKESLFEPEIREKGKIYRLKKVDYEQVDKEPVSIDQKVTKEVKSELIPEGEVYEPEQEITEEGVTYTLKHVTEERQEGETYTQQVTGYTDYSYPISKSSVPGTKQVTAKNKRTGEQETVTCNLTGVETVGSDWEDTYIDITFISYNATVFRWQGITVSKNSSQPLAGYEKELLESVGGNTDDYRVKRTYWTSQPYENSDGVLCRDARADVERKITYYRANYIGEIRSENINAGTIYTSTYEGTQKVISQDQFSYQFKVTAIYEEQAGIVPYVLAGVGILLLIALIVIILFLIRKKRKGEEKLYG